MKKTLIHNCTLVNRGEMSKGVSILIEGDRIKKIYKHNESLPDISNKLDATGLICLPGIIDDQVHFRDPGLTHKGDIETESRAALMGGVTSFMDMPNTIPQTTTPEAWEKKMNTASKKAWVNYAFYFGATNDNAQYIRRMTGHINIPGIKVFMGASTGNMLVDNQETLKKIFNESKGIVATHCESEEIIRKNKRIYIEKYGNDPNIRFHPYIRSREACVASSKQAIALAKESGANLHILHLSTADEVELIKAAPKNISAEVCVHHLWFNDKDYERCGTKIKWNPAIKESKDMDRLREAVRSGIINIVATDHAPHLMEEKKGGAIMAASGGPLVQHSLLMMLELTKQNIFTIERVVDVMCHGPADRFMIEKRGYLDEGYYADIVLVDPQKNSCISQETIASKCDWSPLEGEIFQHSIEHVFVNGVMALRNGEVVDQSKGAAKPLTFKKK